MDLTSDVFTTILSPLAAFLPEPSPDPASCLANSPPKNNSNKGSGNNTSQNQEPKQPPSSSSSPPPTPVNNPKIPWRIDAISLTARRFLAIPSFALNRPPLRVDAYLPAIEDFPPLLRARVKPERAIYDRKDVAELEVSHWLVSVLEGWSVGFEEGELERKWWGLPFGSGVVVQFSDDYDEGGGGDGVRVQLVPQYGVEQGMMGVEQLRKMWTGEVDERVWEGVEVVEWERLRFRRQVHEVISLVEVEGLEGRGEVVFKSVLQEQRYMYNELKMLLMLGQHPNVMPRPVGVVTKKGRFGSRRGVCGLLLEWFPLGALRERLLREDYQTTTSMERKFRWARQLTQALVHINAHEQAGFYPDLKPDNIVLREDAASGMLDAVLIDLEQRGGWYAWSPPEIAYLEYLEILASGLPEGSLKDELVAQLREYYGIAEWSPETGIRQRYQNSQGGFSGPWLSLLRTRKDGGRRKGMLERAQVFMLGKMLWCIFEGQPMVRCGIDHEILRDAGPDSDTAISDRPRGFPEFKNTPTELHLLIRACTTGAPEWEGIEERQGLPGVLLRGGKLYPADSGADTGSVEPMDTLKAANGYWRREVEQAKRFMREMLDYHKHGRRGEDPSPLNHALARPTFGAVLLELERIQEQVHGWRETGGV